MIARQSHLSFSLIIIKHSIYRERNTEMLMQDQATNRRDLLL